MGRELQLLDSTCGLQPGGDPSFRLPASMIFIESSCLLRMFVNAFEGNLFGGTHMAEEWKITGILWVKEPAVAINGPAL